MDRNIVYPGAIPLETDLLSVNRNAMVAFGALVAATLGTNTVVDGLAVTPTVPASMLVQVNPGSIAQFTTVDQNSYGSLPADAVDPLMKMGINLNGTSLTLTAPTTSGQSINYLIEAAFQEADVNPVVMPYYNAANPASPYLGPANSGAAQNTARVQRVQITAKAGAPATTNSQLTPALDAGWVALAVVTVAYNQVTITSTSIAAAGLANTIPFKLPVLRPGFSSEVVFTASGSFVVPSGVTVVKATVIGGGGAGGTHATLPAAGGGAGGRAIKIITGLVPGTAIAVTVGAGGIAPASPGNGGSGGSSSFGGFVSATGASGGGGGTAAITEPGGPGGVGAGGDANFGGSFGTDAIVASGRGGDGGGPGSGRGTTGLNIGMAALGWGGGGGGGGASTTTGAQGGNGGGGLVIVEY